MRHDDGIKNTQAQWAPKCRAWLPIAKDLRAVKPVQVVTAGLKDAAHHILIKDKLIHPMPRDSTKCSYPIFLEKFCQEDANPARGTGENETCVDVLLGSSPILPEMPVWPEVISHHFEICIAMHCLER